MRLLILIFILCVATQSRSQAQEYYNVNQNFLREDSYRKTLIVRTDAEGNVVWAKTLQDLAQSQDDGQYIIATEVRVKNGKVDSNPGDYDYWMVQEEDLVENVKIYPTLCTEKTFAFVGFDVGHRYMCKIFNLMRQEIGTYFLVPGENIIPTINLMSGEYLILSYRNEELIGTSKIIVTR